MRFALLRFFVVPALLLASCTSNQGNFSLVNKATESIAHVSVGICGQTIELNGIKSNDRLTGSYKVTSDSHYTIEVEFQSGRKIKKETGYVTNGMNFRHEITVTDSDIRITDTKVN